MALGTAGLVADDAQNALPAWAHPSEVVCLRRVPRVVGVYAGSDSRSLSRSSSLNCTACVAGAPIGEDALDGGLVEQRRVSGTA
jgi:hypothetical protein